MNKPLPVKTRLLQIWLNLVIALVWVQSVASLEDLAAASSAEQSEAIVFGTPDWREGCEGALFEGRHLELEWKTLSPEIQKALNHPAFGLPESDYREPSFQSLDPKEQSATYYEAWLNAFGGRTDIEYLTHVVSMPSGYIFERIVFDQGSGADIVLASGKTLRDPDFGALGVAWRIRDPKTGSSEGSLIWSVPLPRRYTWHEAQRACADWGGRLPTIKEYQKLADQSGPDQSQGGSQIHDLMGFGEGRYWSSSVAYRGSNGPFGGSPTVWMFDLLSGSSGNASYITESHRVRCVRDFRAL